MLLCLLLPLLLLLLLLLLSRSEVEGKHETDLQFLVLPSNTSCLRRSKANLAADMDRPRMPSPHSFSALKASYRPRRGLLDFP